MANKQIYVFKINDLRPTTVPFGRLLEYYAELKKMLGNSDKIHLVDIKESSHASNLAIDENYVETFAQKINAIEAGNGSISSLRARDTINRMLKEDDTSGSFIDPYGSNILKFPGKHLDDNSQFSITDYAEIVGELYYIAGSANSTIKTRVQTKQFGVVYCRVNRELGETLGEYLFKQVRIKGRGQWLKREDGSWHLSDLDISEIEKLEQTSLIEDLKNINALTSDWPEDAHITILEARKKGGDFH